MLYRKTIIPFSAHDDKIRFVFLGAYFGHTDVVVKSARTGVVEALVTDAIECLVPDKIIPYPVVEISNLLPGKYEIYSTNKNHSERSYGSYIVLTGESTCQQLKACSTVSRANAEALLDAYEKDMLDGPASILQLREKYLETEDDETKIALAKLIVECVSLMNSRMRGGQFIDESYYIKDDETLLVELECDHVLRKDIVTNEIQQCEPLSSGGEVSMPEDDDRFYLYTEIDSEGVPFGFLLTFRPEPIVYGVLKENEMQTQGVYQDALDKVSSLSIEELGFKEEEKPFLAILNELQPESPLFHVPSVEIIGGEVVIKFCEDDKQILSLFPDNFRLAMNPIDIAIDENQRMAVDIPGRDFAVYAYKFNLGSEDFVYWVEDELGNVRSDIAILRMREDYLTQTEIDTVESNDLNARIAKMHLKKYEKHLNPYMRANYYDTSELLREAVSYCESSAVPAQDVASSIISQSMILRNKAAIPDLAVGVMKDKTAYGSFAVDFFTHQPVYKRADFTLAMPPESYVLYKVERYSFENGRTVEYFRSQPHEAIDYHFYDCDYAVFSAYDMRTGRSAGFLFFDFDYENKGRTKMTRFLIDAKEVF